MQKEIKENPERENNGEQNRENVLYLGIDLGTSRAAIAAENGVRQVVPTYVGYPRDEISTDLLKKDIVFGQEALDHRLSLEVIRPLEHGIVKRDKNGKSVKAVQELLRHLLSLVETQPGQQVEGVIGTPARASITDQKILIEATKGILRAVMICSEPFSVAYGFGMLDNVMVVDIGAGTVDICCIHGTLPQEHEQITLDKAGDYVDEYLSRLIKEIYPEAQFTINMLRSIKERYGFVAEESDRVICTFPEEGKPTEFDITNQLREACSSIVPGIVKAIAKLVAGYDPEFQQKLRNNVLLAGGGSQMTGLPDLLEKGMERVGGGKVVRIDEPVFAGANGALKLAKRMPDRYWEVFR
ncbi:MamK family actin-like protein [candidate division KSB1 bacterium]